MQVPKMSPPLLVLIAGLGSLAPILAQESQPNIDRIDHKEFPVRQIGLSALMGKTLEDIQSQILKIQHAD